MAVKLFEDILKEAAEKGLVPENIEDSAAWYRAKSEKLGKNLTPNKLLRDSERLRKRLTIGRMYFFFYDPKHKATLPYYDRFPMVFPIERKPGGFLGINLHYLPLELRAELMDSLMTIRNNDKFDDTTKLIVTYKILKRAQKFKAFRPCLKMYLNNHVQSQFLRIESSEWNIALFLPVERFRKADKKTVWRDSRNKIRN